MHKNQVFFKNFAAVLLFAFTVFSVVPPGALAATLSDETLRIRQMSDAGREELQEVLQSGLEEAPPKASVATIPEIPLPMSAPVLHGDYVESQVLGGGVVLVALGQHQDLNVLDAETSFDRDRRIADRLLTDLAQGRFGVFVEDAVGPADWLERPQSFWTGLIRFLSDEDAVRAWLAEYPELVGVTQAQADEVDAMDAVVVGVQALVPTLRAFGRETSNPQRAAFRDAFRVDGEPNTTADADDRAAAIQSVFSPLIRAELFEAVQLGHLNRPVPLAQLEHDEAFARAEATATLQAKKIMEVWEAKQAEKPNRSARRQGNLVSNMLKREFGWTKAQRRAFAQAVKRIQQPGKPLRMTRTLLTKLIMIAGTPELFRNRPQRVTPDAVTLSGQTPSDLAGDIVPLGVSDAVVARAQALAKQGVAVHVTVLSDVPPQQAARTLRSLHNANGHITVSAPGLGAQVLDSDGEPLSRHLTALPQNAQRVLDQPEVSGLVRTVLGERVAAGQAYDLDGDSVVPASVLAEQAQQPVRRSGWRAFRWATTITTFLGVIFGMALDDGQSDQADLFAATDDADDLPDVELGDFSTLQFADLDPQTQAQFETEQAVDDLIAELTGDVEVVEPSPIVGPRLSAIDVNDPGDFTPETGPMLSDSNTYDEVTYVSTVGASIQVNPPEGSVLQQEPAPAPFPDAVPPKAEDMSVELGDPEALPSEVETAQPQVRPHSVVYEPSSLVDMDAYKAGRVQGVSTLGDLDAVGQQIKRHTGRSGVDGFTMVGDGRFAFQVVTNTIGDSRHQVGEKVIHLIPLDKPLVLEDRQGNWPIQLTFEPGSVVVLNFGGFHPDRVAVDFYDTAVYGGKLPTGHEINLLTRNQRVNKTFDAIERSGEAPNVSRRLLYGDTNDRGIFSLTTEWLPSWQETQAEQQKQVQDLAQKFHAAEGAEKDKLWQELQKATDAWLLSSVRFQARYVNFFEFWEGWTLKSTELTPGYFTHHPSGYALGNRFLEMQSLNNRTKLQYQQAVTMLQINRTLASMGVVMLPNAGGMFDMNLAMHRPAAELTPEAMDAKWTEVQQLTKLLLVLDNQRHGVEVSWRDNLNAWYQTEYNLGSAHPTAKVTRFDVDKNEALIDQANARQLQVQALLELQSANNDDTARAAQRRVNAGVLAESDGEVSYAEAVAAQSAHVRDHTWGPEHPDYPQFVVAWQKAEQAVRDARNAHQNREIKDQLGLGLAPEPEAWNPVEALVGQLNGLNRGWAASRQVTLARRRHQVEQTLRGYVNSRPYLRDPSVSDSNVAAYTAWADYHLALGEVGSSPEATWMATMQYFYATEQLAYLRTGQRSTSQFNNRTQQYWDTYNNLSRLIAQRNQALKAQSEHTMRSGATAPLPLFPMGLVSTIDPGIAADSELTQDQLDGIVVAWRQQILDAQTLEADAIDLVIQHNQVMRTRLLRNFTSYEVMRDAVQELKSWPIRVASDALNNIKLRDSADLFFAAYGPNWFLNVEQMERDVRTIEALDRTTAELELYRDVQQAERDLLATESWDAEARSMVRDQATYQAALLAHARASYKFLTHRRDRIAQDIERIQQTQPKTDAEAEIQQGELSYLRWEQSLRQNEIAHFQAWRTHSANAEGKLAKPMPSPLRPYGLTQGGLQQRLGVTGVETLPQPARVDSALGTARAFGGQQVPAGNSFLRQLIGPEAQPFAGVVGTVRGKDGQEIPLFRGGRMPLARVLPHEGSFFAEPADVEAAKRDQSPGVEGRLLNVQAIVPPGIDPTNPNAVRDVVISQSGPLDGFEGRNVVPYVEAMDGTYGTSFRPMLSQFLAEVPGPDGEPLINDIGALVDEDGELLFDTETGRPRFGLVAYPIFKTTKRVTDDGNVTLDRTFVGASFVRVPAKTMYELLNIQINDIDGEVLLHTEAKPGELPNFGRMMHVGDEYKVVDARGRVRWLKLTTVRSTNASGETETSLEAELLPRTEKPGDRMRDLQRRIERALELQGDQGNQLPAVPRVSVPAVANVIPETPAQSGLGTPIGQPLDEASLPELKRQPLPIQRLARPQARAEASRGAATSNVGLESVDELFGVPATPGRALANRIQSVQIDATGVLVIGPNQAVGLEGLDRLHQRAPEVARTIFVVVGSAALAEAARAEYEWASTQVFAETSDLLQVLMAMPEADRIAVLENLAIAQYLRSMVGGILDIQQVSLTDIRLIFTYLGVPEAIIQSATDAELKDAFELLIKA